jgi:hypothetical protein
MVKKLFFNGIWVVKAWSGTPRVSHFKVLLVDVCVICLVPDLYFYLIRISEFTADQSRHDYIITKRAKAGEIFTFYIEAACNGMFGVGANDAMVADPNRHFNLSKADLVVANKPMQSLFHDLSYVIFIFSTTIIMIIDLDFF